MILNGEKPKAIPLKSRPGQNYPLSSYVFNTVLEAIAKGDQMHTNHKERTQNMAIYKQYDSTHKRPKKFYLETSTFDEHFQHTSKV